MTGEALPPLGLDRFQADFGAWADETFTQSTLRSRSRHLLREAVELVCATHAGDDLDALGEQLAADLAREIVKCRAQGAGAIGPESADILLLLLHLAHGGGFSLLGEAHAKFAEVRGRRWSAPDAAGVVEHLRE
jgi:hypothetical protein